MASTPHTDTTQSTHSAPVHTVSTPSTSIQSPLLLLLSNMSNLMSIKLDYTNYIPWKHQLLTILEAYSLVEHIDGTAPKPSPFVLDASGNTTSVVNSDFQSWNIRDKALLSLINSTLNPQVFSLVLGITSSREVWNTLELICIVLRGLSREFAHFCFAIQTRSDPISYEQLAIRLQSEEQAMTDHLDSVSHLLAMFASNGKASSST